MEDLLIGTQILIVGNNPAQADSLGAALSQTGWIVDVEEDPDVALRRLLTDTPDAVITLEGQARLTPSVNVSDGFGSVIVSATELGLLEDDDGSGAAQRLQILLERRIWLRRISELKNALAGTAVSEARVGDELAMELTARLREMAEYRDDNTREHTERVAFLAVALGRALDLSEHELWLLHHAAPLHDLGKIAIPDSILLKQGTLSDSEFEVIKTHTLVGAQVLSDSNLPLIQTAQVIARSHHERWDGGGYPDRTAADRTPLMARLVQVADVFDVLVHERPYKEAWTVDRAVEELQQGAGTQFDPEIVAALTTLDHNLLGRVI